MGINYNSAALLCKAKQNNVCFDEVLTLGHQTLYLSQNQIKQLATHYNLKMDTSAFLYGQYVDRFFEMFLGAKRVMSLDYSDYQACDIMHDMNYPIKPSYHEKFNVVIDGGSLEHIFNFPVALANCMNMVMKGGSLFIFTMANNHMGHGFYQFSPELFFRIFENRNGFEIHDVILEKHPFPGAELSSKTKCFSVVDPASVKSRIGLVSQTPVVMMVHAVRTETKCVFADYPIQSDYASTYEGNVSDGCDRGVNVNIQASFRTSARRLFSLLPLRFKNFIIGRHQLHAYSFSNRRFYKRWYPL